MVDAALRSRALRTAIEEEMAQSFLGALTPRPFVQRPLLPFGIEALDAVAGGGVPAGALTELIGAGSSGKTSAAMRIAATAMQAGRMCAWVDASDTFDPQTGAANGMLLPQLLWVRCGGHALPGLAGGGQGVLLAEAAVDRAARVEPGRCGSHPRAEAQGLDRAVSRLFQSADFQQSAWPEGSRTGMQSTRNRQKVGTPGAPNLQIGVGRSVEPSPYRRASFQPVARQEQVASDRQGGRKAQEAVAPKPGTVSAAQAQTPRDRTSPAAPAVPAAPGQSEARSQAKSGTQPETQPQPQTQPRPQPGPQPQPQPQPQPRPWTRLDQAVRAADLLLQGGGFSVLVLDLGSLLPEHVLRIPAATWFRFRAVAEASGTAFILLSQAACARSSAALVLKFKPLRMELAGGTVVASVRYEAELARQRFQAVEQRQAPTMRKQPQATWQASPYSGWAPAPEPAQPMPVAASDGRLHLFPSPGEAGSSEAEASGSTRKQSAAFSEDQGRGRSGILAWKQQLREGPKL